MSIQRHSHASFYSHIVRTLDSLASPDPRSLCSGPTQPCWLSRWGIVLSVPTSCLCKKASYWIPWRVWLTDRTRQGTSFLALPMPWTHYRWSNPLAVPTLVCWSLWFSQSRCSRGRTSSGATRTAYALPDHLSCSIYSVYGPWLILGVLREDLRHQVLQRPF